MNGDITASSSINRQVSDILRITGQSEVLQSFVRSDITQESEESQAAAPASSSTKPTPSGKEKKHGGIGWKPSDSSLLDGAPTSTEKGKEDSTGKTSSSQSYQQLGRDAQFAEMKLNGKNRRTGVKFSRRQRLIEEVYTDKDRAAAVNLGSRDIKQSLRLKKRQDRTRILEISEEAHPGTLLALAIHRFKTGDVYVALKFVNKALELNPYDKNALVARSKCHLLMGNASLALKDAEQALAEDKTFIKGLYQKAEALYHLAQFEYSLMYFHRGLHIRPQMEDFRLGVHKAQQAICNTIGKSVPCFEKFYSQKLSILSEDNVSKDVASEKKNSLIAKTENTNAEKFQDKKLLKELHTDKIYFEKLMRNPDINCTNVNMKTDNKIISEAKEGMQFLEGRQYFWKQQQALVKVKGAKSPQTGMKNSKIRYRTS